MATLHHQIPESRVSRYHYTHNNNLELKAVTRWGDPMATPNPKPYTLYG